MPSNYLHRSSIPFNKVLLNSLIVLVLVIVAYSTYAVLAGHSSDQPLLTDSSNQASIDGSMVEEDSVSNISSDITENNDPKVQAIQTTSHDDKPKIPSINPIDKGRVFTSDAFEVTLNDVLLQEGRYIIDLSVKNILKTEKPFSSIVTVALSNSNDGSEKSFFVSDLYYTGNTIGSQKILDRSIRPGESVRGYVVKKSSDGTEPTTISLVLYNSKDLSKAAIFKIK